LRIDALTLHEIHIRLKSSFETSFGQIWERRILLVEACSDGLCGWGEVTAGEGPFYNPETTDTSWSIFSGFVAPLAIGKNIEGPGDLPTLLAPIRGHEMTKAALENALWDIESQRRGTPLASLLGGTAREIACGVSLGIQTNPEALLSIIERELDAGYQRIKIKIKPGKDLAPVQRLRQDFPRIKLMVDANSAYTLEDWPLLKQLEGFYLMMIEQPLGWDDLYSHVELQKRLDTPICLDECIHTEEQARAAVELGACKIINLKLGRVGGYTVASRIHDFCLQRGVPVWCGGMLESGIGRAHNIALSTLPNFTLPGDVTASKRYWAEDLIDPEVTVSPQGTIRVPAGPGIGFEPRRELIEKLTVRKERLV